MGWDWKIRPFRNAGLTLGSTIPVQPMQNQVQTNVVQNSNVINGSAMKTNSALFGSIPIQKKKMGLAGLIGNNPMIQKMSGLVNQFKPVQKLDVKTASIGIRG